MNILTEEMLDFCDKVPFYLVENDLIHLYVFRKLLEWAMTNGRWAGSMPEVS